MRIYHQLDQMRAVKAPICLAAGFFDGVHIGHQDVLRQAIACARRHGGEAWAITFDRHPLKILLRDQAPQLLTSTPHRLSLMAHMGLDGCLVLPFTRRLAALQAEDFLAALSRSCPTLRHLFVGDNWRFGCQGQGDPTLLRRWFAPRGIGVTTAAPILWHRQPVSSTRVRAAVTRGQLTAATSMLGRPFSMMGTVVHGRGVGRRLGHPTANLLPHNEVRPPVGVYAVEAVVDGVAIEGVLNFGHHPTLSRAASPLFELHLLDVRSNLYGHIVEVFFFAALRLERHFASPKSLQEQILRDIAATRRILNTPRSRKLWKIALQTWATKTIVHFKKEKQTT